MSAGVTAAVIVVAVIVIAAVAVAAMWPRIRTSRLRRRFGPEYDRTVAEHDGDHKEAEKDLSRRLRRHRDLDIKPLSAEAREQYKGRWAATQEQFVDHPAKAVVDADQLVTELLRERGYPTDSHADTLVALSVHHARGLQDYRDAHATARRAHDGEASTEEMREAVVRIRVLFDDLIGHSKADDRLRTPVEVGEAQGQGQDKAMEERQGTTHEPREPRSGERSEVGPGRRLRRMAHIGGHGHTQERHDDRGGR